MILIIIGIVLVFTGRYLIRLGHELSTEILKNLIKVETNGLYAIDFNNVSLDLREKKLVIDSLILQPTNARETYQKTIYDVHIEKVLIHLKSIHSIYLKRELMVDSVRIIDPSLKLTNPIARQDSSNFSAQTGDLYQAIDNQLSILKIDKFRIENANIEHQPSNFRLHDIQFSVNELLMDSTGLNGRIFYSNKITLELNEQKLMLPDSIHEVGFEKFLLSTSDSVLRFTNAFVRPIDTANVSFYQQNEFNVYDITLPSIELTGVDYVRAYIDNVLAIDRVAISSPIILVDDETENKKAGSKDNNDLLKLLTGVFDEIEIGSFELSEANVDIKLFGGDQEQRLSSKRTGIAMFGIHLDTINSSLSSEYSYFDSARFTLYDYQYNLPDSVHQIKVDRFTLDTKDSSMRFDNLQLKPARYSRPSQQVLWLEIPKGELTGARFKMALLGDQLRLRDFNLYNPDLRIKAKTNTKKSSDEKLTITPQDIYKLLSIRYKEFESRGVNIYGGRVYVDNHGVVDDINIGISKIALDKSDTLWTDLLESLHLQTGTISWKLDTLDAKLSGIDISEKGRHIMLNDLSIKDHDGLINLGVKEIELKGHRPNMVAIGDFYTDTVVINQPTIRYKAQLKPNRNDSTGIDLIRGLIPPSIGYMVINNGRLNATTGNLNTSLSNLNAKISHDTLEPLDMVSFANFSAKTEIPFNSLSRVGKFSYDRINKGFELSDIEINAVDSLWLKIPFVRTTDFNQHQLLQFKQLLMGQLVLGDITASIDMKQLSSLKQDESPQDSGQLVVNIDRIMTTIDQVKIYNNQANVAASDFSLQLEKFSTVAHQLFNNDSYLFSDDLFLNGNLLITNLKNDTIRISGLDFQSDVEKTKVKYLRVKQGNNLTGDIYNINISGLNIDSLVNHNTLNISAFNIDSSNIDYSKPEQQIAKSVISLPWKSTSIGALNFNRSDIRILDPILSTSTELNAIHLNVEDLLMDSLINTNRWFDYMGQLSLGGSNYDESINADYQLQLGSYEYNLNQNQLSLGTINVLPKKDRYTYSSALELQKSWFDVKVDSVIVRNPDLNALMSGRIYVPRVAIENVNADIYRDKGKPFPQDQYLPMIQKSLHQIGYPMWIDTLSVTGSIRYSEKPEDTEIEGLMTFDQLNASLYNLRTMDTLPGITMRFESNGKFYDSAPFSVKVNFDQRGPDYKYRMTGNVRDFDLTLLNQMLGPVAGVNIRSGYGEEIDFDFEANDRVATGDMRFRYDDLRVTILNKKTREAQGVGSGIKSFFANTFVVKKKNPGLAFFVKKGDIFYERDTSRAIFNYWGKSLISGIVGSIGINRSARAHKRYIKKLEAVERERLKMEKQKAEAKEN